MQLSINFGFLGVHDAKLVELGARAEDYFSHDPATAIIKLRQFAELLAKLIAARHAVYEGGSASRNQSMAKAGWG
jgi:type I restriction enzyme, R subunit